MDIPNVIIHVWIGRLHVPDITFSCVLSREHAFMECMVKAMWLTGWAISLFPMGYVAG